MSDPQYFVCPVCGVDRFLLSRRLYLLKLEDGKKQRNWADDANSSSEIVCANDGTRLRWNNDTQNYVIVPKQQS